MTAETYKGRCVNGLDAALVRCELFHGHDGPCVSVSRLQADLAAVRAERDMAVAQCDQCTDEAGKMAVELAEMRLRLDAQTRRFGNCEACDGRGAVNDGADMCGPCDGTGVVGASREGDGDNELPVPFCDDLRELLSQHNVDPDVFHSTCVASATAELRREMEYRATRDAGLIGDEILRAQKAEREAAELRAERDRAERDYRDIAGLVAELRAELERTREQHAAYCSRVLKAFVEAAGEDWSDYNEASWEAMVAIVGRLYDDWRELDDRLATARTEALREAAKAVDDWLTTIDRQACWTDDGQAAEMFTAADQNVLATCLDMLADRRPSTPTSPTTSAPTEQTAGPTSEQSQEPGSPVSAGAVPPAPTCPECGKPHATPEDSQRYAEGEGRHLCWEHELAPTSGPTFDDVHRVLEDLSARLPAGLDVVSVLAHVQGEMRALFNAPMRSPLMAAPTSGPEEYEWVAEQHIGHDEKFNPVVLPAYKRRRAAQPAAEPAPGWRCPCGTTVGIDECGFCGRPWSERECGIRMGNRWCELPAGHTGDHIPGAVYTDEPEPPPSPTTAPEEPMQHESLESQVDRLAAFILAEVPGEPSENEGAIDTAIRWMRARLDSPTTAGDPPTEPGWYWAKLYSGGPWNVVRVRWLGFSNKLVVGEFIGNSRSQLTPNDYDVWGPLIPEPPAPRGDSGPEWVLPSEDEP